MNHISLFYFSGTGNTWWVANQLAKKLEEISCYQVTTYSIEQCKKYDIRKILEASQIVLFGYPIYGSDIPENMKKFLQTLPQMHIDVGVFCTQNVFSGDGGRVIKEFLPNSYKLRWSEHFKMPNNICITSAWFYPYTTNQKKINKYLEKVKIKVNYLAGYLIANESKLKYFSMFSKFLGMLQRVPYRKVLLNAHRDKIRIDHSKCTKCNLCYEICPVNNIYTENDKYKAHGNCILCMRCYNFCPVNAVLYNDKEHLEKRGTPYRGPVKEFNVKDLTK